jgi:hypothetical protein
VSLINLDEHYRSVAREFATFGLPFALFVWAGAPTGTCYANVEPEVARQAAAHWIKQGLVELPDSLDADERAGLLDAMRGFREELAQRLLPGADYAMLLLAEGLPRIYLSSTPESERQGVAVRLATWHAQVELVPDLFVFAGDVPRAA